MEFKTQADIEAAFGAGIEELADMVIDGYMEEYPKSESLQLGRDALRTWTLEELEELFCVLLGEEPLPRANLVYSGDVVTQVDAALAPLSNFIEDKLFVARMLAAHIWRTLSGEPRKAQILLAAIEKATLEIVRANMHHYADECLPSGSLSRRWREDAMSTPKSPGSGLGGLFTPREIQVLSLSSQGRPNGEIAAALGISKNTVKNHLARLYDKTGTNNRTELARWAMEHEAL